VKPLKNHRVLLALFLFAIAVATPVPHAYSSTLTITVFTDKASYVTAESITVNGNLTYNGSPVQDWPVALEVQDPTDTPVITRTPQTDTNGMYNLTFKLPTDAKLGTYTVYVSSSYKAEVATHNTTFKLGNIYETTITVEGNDYTVTVESNATITNPTATRTTLNFTSSGPTGQTAYLNTTIPAGLNRTEIKAFIDNNELIPPPFPIITSNGSHYFIYLEFTLSAHNITVQYAITDIAISNITPTKTVVGRGYTIRTNATIQNQGNYTETFNATLYAGATAINQTQVTLTKGNSTTITFMWDTTGFAYGNHTLNAYAWPVPGETNTADNNLTGGTVCVGIPGDIKYDGTVNILDAIVLGNHFLETPSSPGWSRGGANADINGDGVVNILDAIILGNHFLQHYP
jgi:hypothetical protein